MKKIIVLADAAEDIEAARDFYESRQAGVGEYCVDSLLTDIGSLGLFSGIHPVHFGFHRMLASRAKADHCSIPNSSFFLLTF